MIKVDDLLKDSAFLEAMKHCMPIDMKKALDYATKTKDLIESKHDPAFFDTHYYHALSKVFAETQETATLKNMTGALSDKALRITLYIFMKHEWQLIENSIKMNLIEHPDKISKEDVDKADKLVEQFTKIVEDSQNHIFKTEGQ
jgi:hypothetical protein